MLIVIVAGARPNFMKVGPIINAIRKEQERNADIQYRLVHTGQHYDRNMSGAFFAELGIPEPDINLEAGGGSQAEQTAAIMVKFEKYLLKTTVNVVLVVGDVTSTMACTIVAKKSGIPVVHVEAGIRSGDMTMPEEVNRIVTDSICDHFFTTSETANEHLRRSGVSAERIHFVGNTMIDSLYQNLPKLKMPQLWNDLSLSKGNYYLTTLHRPSNVDNVLNLENLLDTIVDNADMLPVIFPVHPRTKKILDSIGYSRSGLITVDPMSYLEFIYLVSNAKAVITDSGGVTEEATVLNIPCLTLRTSTERPETVTMGTNELVGSDPKQLIPYLKRLKAGKWKVSEIPPLWDGESAGRIVGKLIDLYEGAPG